MTARATISLSSPLRFCLAVSYSCIILIGFSLLSLLLRSSLLDSLLSVFVSPSMPPPPPPQLLPAASCSLSHTHIHTEMHNTCSADTLRQTCVSVCAEQERERERGRDCYVGVAQELSKLLRWLHTLFLRFLVQFLLFSRRVCLYQGLFMP